MSKFKVGDRVILIEDSIYGVTRVGWTGVIEANGSGNGWSNIKWEQSPGTLAVRNDHIEIDVTYDSPLRKELR